jgi:hypothetical protein
MSFLLTRSNKIGTAPSRSGVRLRAHVVYSARILAGIVVSLLLRPSATAAPLPPPKQPLQLSLTLDRHTYYQWEPIFAEVTLANRHPQPVTIPANSLRHYVVWFEYKDEKGKTFTLSGGAAPDSVNTRTMNLNRVQPLKTWIDLQRDFWHIPDRPWLSEPGSYTMRAISKSAFSFGGAEPPVETEIVSEPITFKIVPPAGAQKQALDLIRRTIAEGVPPVMPKDPKDPKSIRAAQEETEDQVNRLMSWWLRHRTKLPEVIEVTKGERFGVAALYEFDPARCYVSPEATPPMKALCAYKLFVRGGYAGTKAEQETERRRWAEVLVNMYPNAIQSIEARKYLEGLSKPNK